MQRMGCRSILYIFHTITKDSQKKKVLIRENKRHTARRVASTSAVMLLVLGGGGERPPIQCDGEGTLPPLSGDEGTVPPSGWMGVPPSPVLRWRYLPPLVLRSGVPPSPCPEIGVPLPCSEIGNPTGGWMGLPPVGQDGVPSPTPALSGWIGYHPLVWANRHL